MKISRINLYYNYTHRFGRNNKMCQNLKLSNAYVGRVGANLKILNFDKLSTLLTPNTYNNTAAEKKIVTKF